MDKQERKKPVLEIAKKAYRNSMPYALKTMFEEKTAITGQTFIMYSFSDYQSTLIKLPGECFKNSN